MACPLGKFLSSFGFVLCIITGTVFTFIVHQEPLQMGGSNEEARKRLGAIADRHPAVQDVKSLLHTSSRTLFVFYFFVVIKPENPYFDSHPGREVQPLGVYPHRPHSFP